MASITAVVDDVTAKKLEKGTIFTVVAGGKKFSTFKLDIAEQAKACKGLLSTIEYEAVQKGEYTNYYVNSVKAEKPAQEFTQVAGKDEQIARAVALKAAVDFQAGKGSVADVVIAADEFLVWLGGGTPKTAAQPSPGSSESTLDDDVPFAPVI